MNRKEFEDITTECGCTFREYTKNGWNFIVVCGDKVLAFVSYYDLDKEYSICFRDRYLKWHQTFPYFRYNNITSTKEYRKKLLTVVNQNR